MMRAAVLSAFLLGGASSLMFHSKAVSKQWDTVSTAHTHTRLVNTRQPIANAARTHTRGIFRSQDHSGMTPIVAENVSNVVHCVKLPCILWKQDFFVAQLEVPQKQAWENDVHPHKYTPAREAGKARRQSRHMMRQTAWDAPFTAPWMCDLNFSYKSKEDLEFRQSACSPPKDRCQVVRPSLESRLKEDPGQAT